MFRRPKAVWNSIFGGLIFLTLAFDALAESQPSVSVALVVAVDVSQSVDDARFALQMEGIASALEDPGVLSAMTGSRNGIFFAMVTWADRSVVSVAWRRIANRADAASAAAQVRATARQTGEFTCLAQMFRTLTATVIPDLPASADRMVVDVSGDGIDNCTDSEELSSQQKALLQQGATINGLPILVPGENDVVGATAYRAPGYGLRESALPQERGDLVHWYADHVIGGPGAFLQIAEGYSDFSRALRRKFVMEISER
jgi:hypothetical protein